MQTVILAGGLGTRMKPLTAQRPKALIPVAEEPFAYHQLRWLAAEGVRDVVYSIGYRGDQIRAAIGDGSAFGIRVTYVDEGPSLRGTAGALRVAADAGALDETFAVLYGDSYLPLKLEPVWRAYADSALPALLTVLRNENRWDRSNVVYERGRVLVYAKGGTDPSGRVAYWIDYGLAVLSRDLILECVESGTATDLADVYNDLSVQGRLAGFEVFQRFYEVGSPTGLRELELFLASQRG